MKIDLEEDVMWAGQSFSAGEDIEVPDALAIALGRKPKAAKSAKEAPKEEGDK